MKIENQENLFTPDCIRTRSGKYVNVFDPTPEMICIEDIAHALCMQCRFGGHLPYFYSVAQHSAACCALAAEEHKLAALLHDASEAYLMDIPRPIKNRLTNYKEIEHGLMLVISEKFGFQYPLHEDVKKIDEDMLCYEWDAVMLGKGHFQVMDYNCVYNFFMNQFKLYSSDFILEKAEHTVKQKLNQ